MSDVSKINVIHSKSKVHFSAPLPKSNQLHTLDTSSFSSTVEEIDFSDLLEPFSKATDLLDTLENTSNNVVDDISDFFSNVSDMTNDTKSQISDGYHSLLDILDEEIDAINNADVKNFFHDLVDGAREIPEVYHRTKATLSGAFTSLAEGVLKFGETLVDLFVDATALTLTPITMITDKFSSIFNDLSNVDVGINLTDMLWNQTKTFVSKDYVGGWFDDFYENNDKGKWIKNNAYAFDTIRTLGNGIGEVAGIVGLTFLTGGAGGAAGLSQMSVISGASGMGKSTEKSWNDGASTSEGLTYGALNGIWNGVQYYVGGKIGAAGDKIGGKLVGKGASQFQNKITSSLTRIVLDGIDGGAEGFIDPLLQMTYKDKSYKDLFEESGGIKNVLTQTVVGSGSSFLGEVFDLGRYFKDNKVDEVLHESVDSKVMKFNHIDDKTIIRFEENAIENIEKNLKDAFKIDPIKTVLGVPTSMINFIERFRYVSILDNSKLMDKITDQGLYHFTSLDSAEKILSSGYLKKSGNIKSYGKKKSFFFAGQPSFEDMVSNLDFQPKKVAVKFDIDDVELSDFSYRKYLDQAVTYDGDYHFNPEKAKIVYFGLTSENGTLKYKELSKEQYEHYIPNVSKNTLTKAQNYFKFLCTGLEHEVDFFENNAKILLSNINDKLALNNTNATVTTKIHSLVSTFVTEKGEFDE